MSENAVAPLWGLVLHGSAANLEIVFSYDANATLDDNLKRLANAARIACHGSDIDLIYVCDDCPYYFRRLVFDGMAMDVTYVSLAHLTINVVCGWAQDKIVQLTTGRILYDTTGGPLAYIRRFAQYRYAKGLPPYNEKSIVLSKNCMQNYIEEIERYLAEERDTDARAVINRLFVSIIHNYFNWNCRWRMPYKKVMSVIAASDTEMYNLTRVLIDSRKAADQYRAVREMYLLLVKQHGGELADRWEISETEVQLNVVGDLEKNLQQCLITPANEFPDLLPDGLLSAVVASTHGRILNDILRNLCDDQNVAAVILYGSLARGDCTAKSDIDLQVLLENGPGKKQHFCIGDVEIDIGYDVASFAVVGAVVYRREYFVKALGTGVLLYERTPGLIAESMAVAKMIYKNRPQYRQNPVGTLFMRYGLVNRLQEAERLCENDPVAAFYVLAVGFDNVIFSYDWYNNYWPAIKRKWLEELVTKDKYFCDLATEYLQATRLADRIKAYQKVLRYFLEPLGGFLPETWHIPSVAPTESSMQPDDAMMEAELQQLLGD